MPKSVAIVTPWFGPDANGGAESLARELARRLAASDAVTLLTTTSRSFLHAWDENFYPAGATHESGYDVIRFAVDPRDVRQFDALNARLLGMAPQEWHTLEGAEADTDAFIRESINSTALESHLRDAGSRYDAVIFLPYLYGAVVRGIEAYAGASHLLPCLHDEVYARLPRIRRAVHRAAGLLFNSEGEAELALRLFGPGVLHKSTVVGSGIERPAVAGERGDADVPQPYVLYLGRRDPTKNVEFLTGAFARYRERRNGRAGRALSLVLAGPGSHDYGDAGAGIIDLGFVDDAMKQTLLANAQALVQPSVNESYSRVLMEAWMQGTPCAAHGDCLATATALERSGGGWTIAGLPEWADVLDTIEALEPAQRTLLASRGRAYAEVMSDWDRVVGGVRAATGLADRAPVRHRGTIDQVVQTLEFGDAISEEAVFFREHLRDMGYRSRIYAEAVGERVRGEADVLGPKSAVDPDALVYHHSIQCGATERVLAASVPKALVYHNITPAEFFRPYDATFAELLEGGRRQLSGLLGNFDVLIADSDFNARELTALGATRTPVTIPPVVDFARFDVMPDRRFASRLRRGARWLFVGRVAPNKGLTKLIDAFEAFLAIDPGANLAVVGRYGLRDPYFRHVRGIVEERGLCDAIEFAGMVDNAALHAFYRTSDVFVTMSEHEGFCVPVIEAMMFDLPIVALDAAALPETLGAGGLLVGPEAGEYEIAALVAELLGSPELRAAVIAAQRARRAAFFPERVGPLLDALAATLVP